MWEAQDLKIQADAAKQKEAVVKAHLQPWLNEAFVVSTTIEHKVDHMQAEYATMETIETRTKVLATHMERMQRITKEFVVSTSDEQKMLTDLHAKLAEPAE